MNEHIGSYVDQVRNAIGPIGPGEGGIFRVRCVGHTDVSIEREMTEVSQWDSPRWLITVSGDSCSATDGLLTTDDCVDVIRELTGRAEPAIGTALDNAREAGQAAEFEAIVQ